ncbi:MAG: hypothetical protein IKW77_07600 [Salinivirgaceae bacterium]|nr:hypothetical protein [Salinivirgaceae bacterium]
MVNIEDVYSYFSKDEFFTTEYYKLNLWYHGDITSLSYGDPEISMALVKKNKEFFRIHRNRNNESIKKKYLSEFDACHDFILFDFLKDKINDEAFRIELKQRCFFDMHVTNIDSIDQIYNMFSLFGFPDKYISSNKNPRENTIIVDAFSDKITVDVVKNKRINICTLEGTLNQNSMLLWVMACLFWKLMEYKQDLQNIGIIGDDYLDSDILSFVRI